MVLCINLTYLWKGWITSNPKWKSKNTTWQSNGLKAGWRRSGSKSEHNINQTIVWEYTTQNGLYPTCAPNTVMLFSIQIICRCQFNLIFILLVLRLFQSFFRLSFVEFTSETFRLYLVFSFCSCLAVRKAYAY